MGRTLAGLKAPLATDIIAASVLDQRCIFRMALLEAKRCSDLLAPAATVIYRQNFCSDRLEHCLGVLWGPTKQRQSSCPLMYNTVTSCVAEVTRCCTNQGKAGLSF
jgi:hypothetical protein